MNKNSDLEMSILACMLIKPELTNELKLEERYFEKHKRLLLFLKSCYAKFGSFDIRLMYSVCKNKYQIIEYVKWLLDMDVKTAHFEQYQKQLKELCEEQENEKLAIDKIFKLSNDLLFRNITVKEFKEQVDDIVKTFF